MITMNDKILELINRRERQILVHACCYYAFNENLISDYQYDQLATDLMDLIKNNPKEFEASVYYYEFKDYAKEKTPSAYNLNYRSPEILNRAYSLILMERGLKNFTERDD